MRFGSFCGANAIRNDGPPGRLAEIRGLDKVERLPGVESLTVAYHAGDMVPTTESIPTIPVRVLVSAPDHRALLQRLAAVRDTVELVIRTGRLISVKLFASYRRVPLPATIWLIPARGCRG